MIKKIKGERWKKSEWNSKTKEYFISNLGRAKSREIETKNE